IRYRVTKYETEWSEVSAQVSPQESSIELLGLSPGHWYQLNIKAVNEAGAGEHTYHFATLTAQGGTVSPLSEREPPLGGLESITIVIPVICSVIVLTVILVIGLIVINKRRPLTSTGPGGGVGTPGSRHPSVSQQYCRDDQLLSSAYHLSVLDSQPQGVGIGGTPHKDSHENHCFHTTTVLNEKQLYFQSPYALSRVVDHKLCAFDGIDSSD
ncbi:unnamed protein product, partial [Medioppia subpectinata]